MEQPLPDLPPQDLLVSVIKVADEVEVDVSIHAWKVSYQDAIGTAREVVLEGVRVPYLGYDSLIASKQTLEWLSRKDSDPAKLLLGWQRGLMGV